MQSGIGADCDVIVRSCQRGVDDRGGGRRTELLDLAVSGAGDRQDRRHGVSIQTSIVQLFPREQFHSF